MVLKIDLMTHISCQISEPLSQKKERKSNIHCVALASKHSDDAGKKYLQI